MYEIKSCFKKIFEAMVNFCSYDIPVQDWPVGIWVQSCEAKNEASLRLHICDCVCDGESTTWERAFKDDNMDLLQGVQVRRLVQMMMIL